MTADQLNNYLQRIHFQIQPQVSVECLFQLQKQHLMEVPFENLDIHLHKPIKLKAEDFYEKIVLHNRGGFCYELNGLFADLLTTIGFEASLISCRPYNDLTKTYGVEFDHLAIIVLLKNNKWLVDVGFGDFSLEPLKIENDTEQPDGQNNYRIIPFEDGWLVQRIEKDDWSNEYSFSENPHRLEEFGAMCHYHQTSPKSHFTKNRVCSKFTNQGRTTLSDTKLKLSQRGNVTEIEVKNDQEFKDYLQIYFGIAI